MDIKGEPPATSSDTAAVSISCLPCMVVASS
jgi:hypothetical protein